MPAEPWPSMLALRLCGGTKGADQMADEAPEQPQRNWGLTGAERAEKDAERTVFVRALAPEVDDVVSRAELLYAQPLPAAPLGCCRGSVSATSV